jgi:hypothetical protein
MGLKSGDRYRLNVEVNGTAAADAWAVLEPAR